MAGYEDFVIRFERRGDSSYHVAAQDGAGATANGTFALPPERHLTRAVRVLGSMRDVGVDDRTAQERTAQEIGDELATALLSGPIEELFVAALRQADASGDGLRIRLSLDATPELLDVPWELLYRRPTFLASQRRTPIVRYLDVGDPVTRQRITGTVRILGVVADPRGLAPLDVDGERSRLERALATMVATGEVTLDWLDPATPASLRRTLRDGNYHVLHFIGHGGMVDGQSVLAFEDEQGQPAYVSHTVLVNLLGDQRTLCLAVLNSCRGARATLTDPYAGMATSLVALGVSAVVAMQFAITDEAAIAFSEELYTALIVRRLPIDAAVAEGRKAVLTDVDEVEWATPVLFSHSRDGILFEFGEPEAAPAPDRGRRHVRRPVLVAIGAAVLVIAGVLVGRALIGTDGAGDDVSSEPTSGAAVGVEPDSTVGQFDLLPECPTPTGEGWTDLGSQAPAIDVGNEPTRYTYRLDALASRAQGADRLDVLSLTMGVSEQSPSNPHVYWWEFELAVGAERLDPVCFSTLDAADITAGTTGRLLVGFELASAPGPAILLIDAGVPNGLGRFDLATT